MTILAAETRFRLAPGWPALAWTAALVAASLTFTLGFACATPLAGIGAVAALTLPRRAAVGAMVAVWAANQAAGFLILGYPRTDNAFAWGFAIGAAALLAMEAGRIASHFSANVGRAQAWTRAASAFGAAFVAFECALCAASIFALGGLDAYSPAIVGRIFVINACAAAGLLAVHALATSRAMGFSKTAAT